ncbi:MAG: type II toxin-antitoxin system mRNA interferase toxin, RelE/StbE family [Candidatus Omnitrophota bacterium]
MRIELHRNFEKAFAKLNPKQRQRVKETLDLFRRNPYDPQLKNHSLHGCLKGERSISAGGDLRLIFEEEDDYRKVVFVRVGTHNQIYE